MKKKTAEAPERSEACDKPAHPIFRTNFFTIDSGRVHTRAHQPRLLTCTWQHIHKMFKEQERMHASVRGTPERNTVELGLNRRPDRVHVHASLHGHHAVDLAQIVLQRRHP